MPKYFLINIKFMDQTNTNNVTIEDIKIDKSSDNIRSENSNQQNDKKKSSKSKCQIIAVISIVTIILIVIIALITFIIIKKRGNENPTIKNNSIDNDETDKDNDESGKDNDETDKDNDETDKDNDETNKDNDGTGKDNDEPDKDNDENGTDNDEAGNDNDESGKNNDENGKDSDETGKDNDETGIDNDETDKDNDETGKDNDETGKDNDVTGTDNDENGKDNDGADKDNDENGKDNDEAGKDNDETGTDNNFVNDENLKKEFEILTKTGDLRKISVVQKSKEKTKLNNEIFTSEIIRKTNYDIYFKSEEDASEKNKKYYSKMYSAVVSINSECTTENSDDCEPQPLVDLTSTKSRNIRNLNSANLENIPIPICLFNITDNHVITTLTCPKSLPDNKKNEIILDLYFFRPPAAERINKVGDNITLTINKDEKTKFTKIHETNGGLCNIYNNFGSICTTEMNTTLDAENNLVIYDEQAITIINYDEENSYTKDKVTNLIDISQKIQKSDIKNYENFLNNLLPLLKPYMKNEIQFTEEEYDDLYKVTKYMHISSNSTFSPEMKPYEPKKTRNTFRNLNFNGRTEDEHIKNAHLFSSTISPIQINLDFKINPGINSPEMGAYGSIFFDDQEIKYSSIEVDSVLQGLIEKLSSISKAGNILASELYDKINGKLDNITNEISIQINSLDKLIMYYDIYQVFNSTLIEYSYKKLPSEIVEISNKLLCEFRGIFNNIRSESGNIKYNVDILSNNIFDYINELHEIIRKMLNNLETLSNVLLKKNNTFTQITNYYLNNTSSSYVKIIQKMKNILDTYYIKEYEKVFPKMKEILDLLELNSNDTLKKGLNSLEELYTNLKERTITINSISESQLQTVISNLENSYQYPNRIIQEIKRYITEIMNIKENGYFISDEDIKNFNNSFIDIISEAKNISKKLDDITIIDKVFDEIMIKFRENYIYTMEFMEEIKSGNFTLEEDVLNTSLFTLVEKKNIETELK